MVDQARTEPRAIAAPPPGLRLGDLLREIEGSLLSPAPDGALDLAISGVRHDSRTVEVGDVFVAREGGRVSGLSFVAEAVRRGAACVIAQRGVLEGPLSVPIIVVDDVPLALARASAAVYGHPTFGLDVVGITGTNGKTTTTMLVRAIIDEAGFRAGLIGTLGYELSGAFSRPATHTSPEADELSRLAREMRDRGATHLVMEVSSIALAARRADGVRFRVAAFTNFTQDHLDYHGTMQAYREAKLRLFTDLGPGAAALNVDDPASAYIASQIAPGTRVLRHSSRGEAGAADVYPRSLHASVRGIDLVAATPAGDVHVRCSLTGAHNVENLLGAISIGLLLDIAPDVIGRALSRDIRVPGRLERCDDPDTDDVVVLVDYAHTPDALERVLASVRGFTSGRVHCVFGCGGDRDPDKRPLMGAAAGRGADVVIVTNDNPRSEDPRAIAAEITAGLAATGTPFTVELDRGAAIRAAVSGAAPGDLVLVAGKGHETYQIIGPTTLSFDDREVARAALQDRRSADTGASKEEAVS